MAIPQPHSLDIFIAVSSPRSLIGLHTSLASAKGPRIMTSEMDWDNDSAPGCGKAEAVEWIGDMLLLLDGDATGMRLVSLVVIDDGGRYMTTTCVLGKILWHIGEPFQNTRGKPLLTAHSHYQPNACLYFK